MPSSSAKASRTYASSYARGARSTSNLKFKLLVLLSLTLLRRRLSLYAAVLAGALVLEALAVFAAHLKHGDAFAASIVVPAVITIVYAFTAADALGKTEASAVWGRILERVWAVIAIDFIDNIIAGASIATAGSGALLDMIVGAFVQFIAATLVFVDVAAVLDDNDRWYMLVPQAYARGLAVAWQRGNLWRCFLVYALSLAALLLDTALAALCSHVGPPQLAFWAPLALGTILSLPISAFTVIVYFDAAGLLSNTTLTADDTVQ